MIALELGEDFRPKPDLDYHDIMRILADYHANECTSLAWEESREEAVQVLRQIVTGLLAESEEDAAARIAKALRRHYELNIVDCIEITDLAPADNDKYESIASEVFHSLPPMEISPDAASSGFLPPFTPPSTRGMEG